jgi:septum formation protein
MDASAAIVAPVRHLRLILASASPRRRRLLRSVGLSPVVRPAHVDETLRAGELPEAAVLRLAESKATAVRETLRVRRRTVVLAADTTVTIDGVALGKPRDPEDARRMLRLLSGRRHEVLTGMCVQTGDGAASASAVARTAVAFRPLDPAWIDGYVSTGEPMDKAGAYGIQGRGVWLAESIDGSWSNVVGLPLELLPGMLREIGVDPRVLLSP